MDLHFLGGATTVTGSQFLLVTDRARVVVDCGMFQGGPNEAVRNRVPFGYDPAEIDAILLTHAHLDHCGLIPHVVAEGYRGPIFATAGTVELATLVLLDSGRLQEEFAKREARWERRHPDKAVEDDRKEREAYDAAVALADAGAVPAGSPALGTPGDAASGEHVPTSVEPATPPEAATIGSASVSEEAAEDLDRSTNPEIALRAQPAEIDFDLDDPLYTEREARAALEYFRPVSYEEEIEVAPGVHATFLDAGHILGSAMIRVRVEASGETSERVILFSGDLGRPDTPIVRDPTVLTEADYLLVESTYGGREHDPQDEAVRILAETVRLVADSNGVLLVPSFAIGRTQEIVWQLDRLIGEGRIPQLPLYLDSPMASKASEIYRRHAEYFDTETRALLESGDTPLDYPDQRITANYQESQAIARAPRPYMIVASNGMLTGGRIIGHLRELIDDPTAVILFVGYQGKGTLGSHIQGGAKRVRIDGQMRDVRCQSRSISGFSAHAGESELLAWIGNFIAGRKVGEAGVPRRVFIVHGDPEAQQALEPKIRALGFETLVPHWHQQVTLD